MALILEAIRILEEGTASAADIDNAVRASIGPRLAVMGPLETVDRAGLDIYLKASQGYFAAFGRDTFRPPQLLADKVAAGELGCKTGRGLQGDTGILDRLDRYDQLATLLTHLAATTTPPDAAPAAGGSAPSAPHSRPAAAPRRTTRPSGERQQTDE